MALTLADLIATKTSDQYLAEMIAALAAVGFPAMSWHTTSVPYRLLRAMAGTFASLHTLIKTVTEGGLLEYSSGAWLTLLAYSVYGLARYQATFTNGTFKLSDLSSVGPINISAGQLWFGTASGKRFSNTASFVVPLDGDITFEVIAENSGSAHNVPTGDVVRLLTPIPGLGFTTDDLSYNPSSAWITASGTDDESDSLLQQRCRDRWSTLAYGANDDWYRYYARNTPTHGVSVTRVRVDTDPAGTGTVTLTLAGPSGPVGATVLAGVNSFLQSIKGNTITVVVQDSVAVPIVPTGTVNVYADYYDETANLASIEAELDTILGALPMGGTVYLTQVSDAIQWDSAMVRNVVLTAPTADTTCTDYQVATRGSLAGLSIVSV